MVFGVYYFVNPNPGKTVALAPKGHVPTLEEITLLAGVGVRIADEGGIKVVGVCLLYTSPSPRD